MVAKTHAESLSVMPVGESFAIACDGAPLRTRGGNIILHRSEELMRHILGDAASWTNVTIDQGVVSAAPSTTALSLLNICLDLTTPGSEPMMKDVSPVLLGDPVLHTIAGPEQISREATYGPVRLWLGDQMPALRRHVTELQSLAFNFEETSADTTTPPEVEEAIESVQWLYNALSAEQRAVIAVLTMMHDRCFLLAMSLIVNPECYADDYADGVIGALMLDPNVFTDATQGETQTIRERVLRDATQAMEFLGIALADNGEDLAEDSTDEEE